MTIFNITKHRSLFLLLLGMLATISLLTSDLYLPAMPVIAEYYKVSHDSIELTITVFMLGLALGQLIYGNILDKYGRRPVLIIGLIIYIFGTIISLFSYSLPILLMGRFVQALGGASAVIAWQSIAYDVDKQKAQNYMPVLYAVLSVSPATAPIIGGFLTTWFGWRSNFIAMFVLGIVLFVLVIFTLPETGKIHLKKTQNHLLMVIKQNQFLLKDKKFLSLGLFQVLNQGNFYAYVTASAFIFHNLGYTAKAIGFFYIPTAFSYFFASLISRQIIKRVSCLKYLLYVGLLLAIVGCSLFAIFAFSHTLSLFKVLLSMSIFLFGCGLFGPVANAKAVTLHDGLSGPAASITGVFGMFAGFLGSGIVAYLTLAPSVSYACVMIVVLVILIINSTFLIKFKPSPSDKKLRPDLQLLER